MSDGPYKSLLMRPAWKRVAKYAQNHAFAPHEVAQSIVPALERDCHVEMTPVFLQSFRSVYDQESLFRDHSQSQLEGLRGLAGSGIGRVVIDFALHDLNNAKGAGNLAVAALTDALCDRAARSARHIEDHYCRNSATGLGHTARAKIDAAIGIAKPAVEALARKLLSDRSAPLSRVAKQTGLDDGVER